MTQSSLVPPLEIAILLNSYKSPFITQIRQSYVRTIGSVSPRSRLSFFHPAEENEFPDPACFDLIVIGGSNVDPRKNHDWIKRVHQFVLRVTRHFPHKKLCGICWGHQTISRIFGGEVVDMDYPELGVTEVKLTPHGQRFFATEEKRSTQILRLQQHHRRYVSVRPTGFIELSEDNQCFLNMEGTILTFQGHPEKDAETAKLRIRDIERWLRLSLQDHAAVDEVLRRMELDHDGPAIWRRILQWAAEGPISVGVSSPTATITEEKEAGSPCWKDP